VETKIANTIKYRKYANDIFQTPIKLAQYCIKLIPIEKGDLCLDNARGKGAFYNNLPNPREWCELPKRDFFNYNKQVDWIITNPPYSKLDDWFIHSAEISRKGFCYLLAFHNITPRRIERMNKMGFALTQIHLCKVFNWFGISAFCIFKKGKENIVGYDRVVWR